MNEQRHILNISILFNFVHLVYGLFYIPKHNFTYIFIPFLYYYFTASVLYMEHKIGHFKLNPGQPGFFWYRHHFLKHHHSSNKNFFNTPGYNFKNFHEYLDLITYGSGGVIGHIIFSYLFNLSLLHQIFSILYFSIHLLTLEKIHYECHSSNSWYTRYEWFKVIQKMHFTHHSDIDYNFGILDFSIDYLFNSLSIKNQELKI